MIETESGTYGAIYYYERKMMYVDYVAMTVRKEML